MKSSKDVFLFAAVAIVFALLSGCVLVPIAGFGYSGYQYHEKEGVFAPGQPLGGPAPDAANKSSSSSASAAAPTPSANNIE
jgi:hypothetical protein